MYIHYFSLEVCSDFSFNVTKQTYDKLFDFTKTNQTSTPTQNTQISYLPSLVKLPDIPPAKWEEVYDF